MQLMLRILAKYNVVLHRLKTTLHLLNYNLYSPNKWFLGILFFIDENYVFLDRSWINQRILAKYYYVVF